ncbi:MAG: hypothetical protein AAF550_11740 [Myxococcota bacterium]
MTMEQALLFHAVAGGVPQADLDGVVDMVPPPIMASGCFFDLLSNLWRYEFGEPWRVPGGFVGGPHLWQPVQNLVTVMKAVRRYLGLEDQQRFMARLAVPRQHEINLAEFMPVVRLPRDVTCEFEFKTGVGNRDVDWRLVRPGHVPLLLDVKTRIADTINVMDNIAKGCRKANGDAPEPDHDPKLLFRSVEHKYDPTDPDVQLQGVWVFSALKQEERELRQAFDSLDPERVHFAVLGGWRRGIRVLSRRAEDVITVLSVFDEVAYPDGYEFRRDEDG